MAEYSNFPVNGSIAPGTLTAVIGPSGAGKSTLLAAVSHRIRGNLSGVIRLNNRIISPHEMKKCSAYLPQQDMLISCLTPSEHMMFLARLKLNFGIHYTKVHEILKSLGLITCANIPIYQLSGGEKRILMLAGELLSNPQLLFCDEPTTGLDSSHANIVVSCLSQIAGMSQNGQKRGVVCSIHQPSSDLFHSFTHIILMQSGRIMFQGTLDDAKIAFSHTGLMCPDHFNPAEFYVQIVSTHANNDKLRYIKSHYEANLSNIHDVDIDEKRIDSCGSDETNNCILQIGELVKRNLLITYRSIKSHVIESTIYLVICFKNQFALYK